MALGIPVKGVGASSLKGNFQAMPEISHQKTIPAPRPLRFGSPYPYLMMSAPWLNDFRAEMQPSEFRHQLDRYEPETRNRMAHELGHRVVGHAAGMMPRRTSILAEQWCGAVRSPSNPLPASPETLQDVLRGLVTRAAGLAGSLELLSAEDTKNPEKFGQLAAQASEDMNDMRELLRTAGNNGWIDSPSLQLPLIDFESQRRLHQTIRRLLDKGGETDRVEYLQKNVSREVSRFFDFPLFKDALATARKMIACIPLEQQLTQMNTLARKETLSSRQAKKLLQSTIDADTQLAMTEPLDQFVCKYSKNHAAALYQKGKSNKASPLGHSGRTQPSSPYGTF